MRHALLISALLAGAAACGGDPSADADADAVGGADAYEGSGEGLDPPLSCDPSSLPYATDVVRYSPGERAGFGQDGLPDVVLGPPGGGVSGVGSLDVLSLGIEGEIVLGFDPPIVNEPGVDFIVWENPFLIGDDPTLPFTELAEVEVSDDGDTWFAFSCDPASPSAPGQWLGCAGWAPRVRFDACALVPIDPSQTGGDPFDLADVGLERARFVLIRDLGTNGDSGTAGFDLDAVGVVHSER